MTTTTTRAAVYLRQSKNKTGEELAVERQRERCLALCKEKGWTPTEYKDDDTSASKGTEIRKHYRQMLDDIAAGKIDAVVVGHPDRLDRNVMEQLQFAEIAVEHDLKLTAPGVGDIDLSTDDGEFMGTLQAALARKEVRRKAARQRDAHKQMVAAENGGRPWWPARPFGYDADLDPVTGKWWTIRRDPGSKAVIAVNTIRKHPTEAGLVKEAYRQFNAGASIRSIVASWNKEGVATPTGKAWSTTAVRDLLLSARNAGLREYGGREYKGTWPAIVKPEVWRRAVRTLQDPERRCGIDRGRKWLLSGIAVCGLCDSALTSTVNARGQRQYVCIKPGCQRIARNGGKLDDLVADRVVWRLSRPDAVELLESDNEDVDTDALREQRQALTDRLVALGKEYANAPAEFRQSALTEMTGQLKAINDVLEAPAKVDIYEGVIGAKDVRKAFAGLDLGRRRTIVNALMTVTVNPSKAGPVFDEDAIDLAFKEDL